MDKGWKFYGHLIYCSGEQCFVTETIQNYKRQKEGNVETRISIFVSMARKDAELIVIRLLHLILPRSNNRMILIHLPNTRNFI